MRKVIIGTIILLAFTFALILDIDFKESAESNCNLILVNFNNGKSNLEIQQIYPMISINNSDSNSEAKIELVYFDINESSN